MTQTTMTVEEKKERMERLHEVIFVESPKVLNRGKRDK